MTLDRLTRKARDGFVLNCNNCPERGACSSAQDCVAVLLERLGAYEEAEENKQLWRLPFVAMVEQSLQRGVMQPRKDQAHNGRYAAVYYDREKWGCPLIDICGSPYNSDQAEARRAELHTAKEDNQC